MWLENIDIQTSHEIDNKITPSAFIFGYENTKNNFLYKNG